MSPTRVRNAMTIAGSGLVGTDGRITMLALPPADTINKYIEYFYEGSVTFNKGVGLVPAHKVEWVERLLGMGYILLDAADASTPEIAAANTASMELNDGAGFLASLGYIEDGPEPVPEGPVADGEGLDESELSVGATSDDDEGVRDADL